jgi:putative tricarboxylic transport membrane protein
MVATALFITLLGAATLWAGDRLGVGALVEPGAGMWPMILGGALVILGLAMLALESNVPAEPLTDRSWLVLVALAVVAAFVWLFAQVGPTVSTFLFMLVWLKLLSGNSWRVTVLVALGSTAALYAIFVLGLSISFPDDLLTATG